MFSLLLVVVLFVGCQKETFYQTVKIKKQYSVALPTFLKKTEVLNDEASLQYQDTNKEFYVIVFDEPKIEAQQALKSLALPTDFTSYSDVVVKDIKASLQNADFSQIENSTINGLEARTFSVTGNFDAIPIYYQMAHLQSKNTFYQIMMWTTPSKKEKYRDEMNKIIASFKELGRRAKI